MSNEEYEDFSTNEEACYADQGEAAFYHFCYELNHYIKSGTWGPRIWKECDPETQAIIKNIVTLDRLGCDDLHNWSAKDANI